MCSSGKLLTADMGKSRMSSKRRRRAALEAGGRKPEKEANKFVLEDKREASGAAAVGAKSQRYPEAGIVKRRKKERRADRVHARIRDVVSGPEVSKVTVRWQNGEEKTYNLASNGGTDEEKVRTLQLFHTQHNPGVLG
ncbi:hypothetical protein IMZ48_26350 [Candidatus Bathyarchaeota archaeon]|nr:hypothetical protein [Candidatus Bathyarchaeota archaeon]